MVSYAIRICGQYARVPRKLDSQLPVGPNYNLQITLHHTMKAYPRLIKVSRAHIQTSVLLDNHHYSSVALPAVLC
jgi:hypothetical protein